jgi:hypothetical protein
MLRARRVTLTSCWGQANVLLGDAQVLTHGTSTYELNRVVGIQMQHLYRALIRHNEAMVELKAEVQRVVADTRGSTLTTPGHVELFRRFLRQTRCMLDDALITILHRSLRRYVASFPAVLGDGQVASRAQSAFDGPQASMLIRMTIVWEGSLGSLEYDPPLSDYEQLAYGVLDETKLTLWELQVLELDGADVVCVELPFESRAMLSAVCGPALVATQQVRFCRYRFCATGELKYRGAVG